MSTSIPQRSGTLLNASPPMIRDEVDRRAVEQVGGLAAERQRLDAAEDVVRLEDRVVAEPRRRAVRREAAHLDADRQHALGLDADVQVGRLAGDREVARAAAVARRARRSSGRRRPRTPRRARRRSARAPRPARSRPGRRTSSPRARPSCRRRRGRSGGRPRSRGVNCSSNAGHDVEVAVQDRRRARRAARSRRAGPAGRRDRCAAPRRSRASSQPLTNSARGAQRRRASRCRRPSAARRARVRPRGEG